MEPGGPPPAATEPGFAPPGAGGADEPLAAEAASWFDAKFSLQLCGKKIGASAARTLLIGAGATIVVLLVVVATMASGDDGAGGPAAPAVPSPAPDRSAAFPVRPPAPAPAAGGSSVGAAAGCGPAPRVANSRVSLSADGQTANYQCAPTYSLWGPASLSCTECGWSPGGCALANQVATCIAPPQAPAPPPPPPSSCADEPSCSDLLGSLTCAHDRKPNVSIPCNLP